MYPSNTAIQIVPCNKNSKYFVIRSYPRETIQLTNCLPPCCLRAKPELGSASTQASHIASCDGTARLWQLAKAARSLRGGTANTVENPSPQNIEPHTNISIFDRTAHVPIKYCNTNCAMQQEQQVFRNSFLSMRNYSTDKLSASMLPPTRA